MNKTISLGKLILKKDRERSLKNRHPWIFSGAVEKTVEPVINSENEIPLYEVVSSKGEKLGTAYINKLCSLFGRMIAWENESALEAIKSSIHRAVEHRKKLVLSSTTTGCRLINGEGDGVPGFIADYYDGHIVIQSATLGCDLLLDILIQELKELLSPKSISERSHSPSRKEEGLQSHERVILGEVPTKVKFLEDGLTFEADILAGQKTGFFFDHREMRKLIGTISKDQKVLNAFCYSGGFSLHAYKGGAKSVTSIDISKDATELCRRNLENNNMPSTDVIAEDVFDYLSNEEPKDFNLIILDPPAFAKNKHSVKEALKGYYEINRRAISILKKSGGGVLLTCSCSYNVPEQDFRTMLFTAARDQKAEIKVLQGHRVALDHPVSIYHPEGAYLKSLLVEVTVAL